MLELTIALITLDSESPLWLLAVGPVGATSFYWAVWMAYRNTDKSHAFEHETEVIVSNMTGEDVKVGENNGTQKRWIQGRNDDKPRERL